MIGNYPRGEIRFKILEAIEEGIAGFFDIWLVMSMPETGFGSSLRGVQYHLDKRQRERAAKNFDRDERQRIYNLIYKLKREGLIKSFGQKLVLTEAGQEKKGKLLESLLMRKHYKKEPGPQIIIFSYDVPEKYKTKRQWLASAMRNIDFYPLQKSVWIGRGGLSEDFLEALAKLDLIHYIHIFSVSKEGTLYRYPLNI